MISRTYIVKMPTSASTTPVDIFVQNNPGTQAAPVIQADAAYYEWRGLPLALPNPSGSTGFVPRFRLGFTLAVAPYGTAISTDTPATQLSASLASLSSTDSGPTISVPAFPDPTGGASIRLIGGAGTAGKVFMVSLKVNETKDEDRNPTGN